MTPQQIIEICQAIIGDKPVQFKTDKEDRWWNYDPMYHSLAFGRTMEWRVKPQPREWWLSIDANGNLSSPWATREVAQTWTSKHLSPIHVREVIDE